MISLWDFQENGMQVTLRTPLYFAERGHHVRFLVHPEATAIPSPLVNLHPNLSVVRFDLPFKWLGRIPSLRRPRQFLFFLVACLAYTLRHCRGTYSPDVIYAAEADAVLIGSLLRRLFRVPLVTRFYGIARIAAHYDAERRSLRRIGRRHLLSRLALTRRADMVIVTNDGTNGKEITECLNPGGVNVRFWTNGVDRVELPAGSNQSLKETLKIAPSDVVLLTLCRLDPMKRVDRAIRALPRIRQAVTGNVRLVVAGDGSERDSLLNLAHELGVDDSTIFVGKVHHRDVYAFYSACDIFLSLYDGSNVGNPLWEALNAGCCIVTLDTGQTGQVIVNGRNGILLDADADDRITADRIARAVTDLVDDPSLRARLATGARLYAEGNLWSWDDRLQAETEAIEDLVTAAQAGSEEAMN